VETVAVAVIDQLTDQLRNGFTWSKMDFNGRSIHEVPAHGLMRTDVERASRATDHKVQVAETIMCRGVIRMVQVTRGKRYPPASSNLFPSMELPGKTSRRFG